MKSTLTIAELEAQADLMGCNYDRHDHTFCVKGDNMGPYIDADTLEPLDADTYLHSPPNKTSDYAKRIHAVGKGLLGAADYEKPRSMSYEKHTDTAGIESTSHADGAVL